MLAGEDSEEYGSPRKYACLTYVWGQLQPAQLSTVLSGLVGTCISSEWELTMARWLAIIVDMGPNASALYPKAKPPSMSLNPEGPKQEVSAPPFCAATLE